MAKQKFTFRGKIKRNFEKRESEATGSRYISLPEGIKLFQPEKGKVRLDILPYLVTDEHHLDRDDEEKIAVPGTYWWRKPFYVHKNIGLDGATIVCPTTVGKKCPICEHVKALKDANEDWENILPLTRKERALYVVIPVDTSNYKEEYEETPYVFNMSYHLFEKYLKEEIDVDVENENFPDLENGKTLNVRFREKKFGKATYYETAKIDLENREDDYEESVLEVIPNLDDMLMTHSYEQIELMFLEMEETDLSNASMEEDNEEEENLSKYKSFRKQKKIKKEEPEEVEEEPEEVEEEPEEVEEEPVGKTLTRRTTKQKSDKERCPHSYKFGIDADKYDVCNDCKIWEECIEEFEILNSNE